MRRCSIARLAELGKSLDNSAVPVYDMHVSGIYQAYALVGGEQAATSKLLMSSTWQLGGSLHQ